MEDVSFEPLFIQWRKSKMQVRFLKKNGKMIKKN